MGQHTPFSIQIELTEGCNLFCKFCGIRGIRKKIGNYKFMTITDAKKIALRIKKEKWTSRIEFAMHGEPLLNPNALEILSLFRKILPNNQIMVCSNGLCITETKKIKKTIKSIFNTGINILAIDDYGQKAIPKIRRQLIKSSIPVLEYPENKKASPHTKRNIKTKIIIFIKDIRTATKGGHSTLNNHCGCAFPPLRKPLKARCAKPFRELSIRYNGKIALCCNDWRGVYCCGDIIKESLNTIWNGAAFTAARNILYMYDRTFAPCNICDAKSFRVGFLPDKMGKMSCPEPSKEDYNLVKKITKNKELASPVLRKWEKE